MNSGSCQPPNSRICSGTTSRAAHAPLSCGIRLLELLAERGDRGLRLLARRARPKAAEHAERVAVAAVVDGRQHQRAERHVDVGDRHRADRPVRLGQHADDVERRRCSASRRCPTMAGFRRIAAARTDSSGPRMRGCVSAAASAALERPPDGRGDAEHLEELAVTARPSTRSTASPTAQVQLHAAEARHRFEDAALPADRDS